MFTRFNSRLPARPESVAAVLKVLSQNDELMAKDIARLGRLTQSRRGWRWRNWLIQAMWWYESYVGPARPSIG